MPSSQTLSALQEKGFRTTFRGFDKNDVLAYLNALDNENRQHSAEQEEQIAQLQAQLDKMRSEQSAARACVEKLQSDLSAANQRAEAAEKSAAEVVARAKSVEERATANLSRNKENQQAVVEWQFRCRDLQKQIDEYEKQIAEYEAMIPKGGMPAPKQEPAPAPQPTPQEKPESAPEPKAPQADVTEEARIEARQILMEARLKADAAEERLKQQAEEQQGRMTEHARDLAASLAMLRERVTRVDERLSAATADLDDATTAIYQALDATGADFEAFGAELRHFGENTAKENCPAAQAKVRHNKSAQPAAKRVRPVRSQPQVQANNANTHRLRRAGDTRRSVSQDLNAELERLNQPAEPFGPGPLCRWRDISPHRGESPSQRGPRGEHTFFDSLHLTLFLFPLPCSRLIRSTRMHRFLESSACRSSELHQPTVQLEYRMQSSGRLSATSNGKRYHYFLLRFYRTKR